ncbi:MAG: hypothetical protein R2709_09125 [Marmoricola sp.]
MGNSAPPSLTQTPAKHPLVYETKVIWGIQLKQHPKMALGWDVCLLHEH